MHELRIASDLSEIVLNAAKLENLSKVTTVNLTFGQMVQIVPEIFIPAFRLAVADTIACNAELNIEIVPLRLKCRNCGSDFTIGSNYFSCYSCGSTDVDIVNGKELFIKTIEGE